MTISKFILYTNKDVGFNSIVPEGWIERRPGEFSRGEPETDPTFLAQLGVPGATIEFVIELLLLKLSLVALPERTGGIENMNLIWDLYTSEIQVPEMGKRTLEMALKNINYSIEVNDEPNCYFINRFGSTAGFNTIPPSAENQLGNTRW